jgi:hypothetical protein
VLFADQLAAAPGVYSIAGQAAGGPSALAAAAGSHSITGGAAIFREAFSALAGGYVVSGTAALFPAFMRGDGGAYIITFGEVSLRRSGGEYDQVYGGIGHYLEAIERARQLAKITRKTPAPIVHDIGPRLQPPAPVAPPLPPVNVPAAEAQAFEVQALAAQRLAEQQARQAALLKRRRQTAELLLLAS